MLSSSFCCYSKICLFVHQEDLTKITFQGLLTHAISSHFKAKIQIAGSVEIYDSLKYLQSPKHKGKKEKEMEIK